MGSIIKNHKDFGGYWIKNLKDFKGHEGEPLFQCTVYKNKKKVGFFSEDSWGGPAQLQGFKNGTEKKLIEFAKTFENSDYGESYHTFISHITDAFDTNRRMKRLCKKNTVYTLKSDAENIYTIKYPFCEKVVKHLNSKFGDDLDEIVNKST